ncbi:MAG: GNAT family N-acetyltransferase [Opitutaceae bacterium]
MPVPPIYHLRPVQLQDAPWLWELKVAAMGPHVIRTWGAWDEPLQRAYFKRGFHPEALRIIVVRGEGDVGLIELARRGSELFLGRLEILPRAQGRGLGTAILSDLQEEARRVGKPIRLQVLSLNPARRLYLRLGFSEVGETDTHVLMSWSPTDPTRKTASPPDGFA